MAQSLSAARGTLKVDSGAIFNDESGTTNNGLTIGATGTVSNAGTWEKTVGAFISTISAAFSSTGTSGNLANVEVAAGTLDLSGGGTDTFTSYSGAGTIDFGGGTRTIDVNSSITTSNVDFNGGPTTVNGTYNAGTSTTVSGGTGNLNVATAGLGAISLTTSGSTLNLEAATATAASLAQSGGTLSGTGTLTVTGAATFKPDSYAESGTGRTLVEGGASITANNSLSLTLSRTLELQGTSTVTVMTGGTINLNNPGQITLDSGAVFNDESGTTNNGLTIGTSGTVSNAGTWEKTVGAFISTVSAAFSSTGTSGNLANVEVAAGTLDLSGGGTDTFTSYSGAGTIDFGGGTRTIDVNSSITTSNVDFNGGTTTVNGTYNAGTSTTVSGGTGNLNVATAGLGAISLTTSGGTLNLEAATATAASLAQSGGTLSGTGTLTVTGAATFNADSYAESGTGRTLVEGGASITANNSLSLTLSGTLELQGTSTVTGTSGGIIGLGTTGTLKLDSGAIFNDESGTSGTGLTISGTTGTVSNAGTWEKTSNTNTTTINTAFSNTGTVEVQTGTLDFNGNLTNSGTVETTATGAIIQLGSSGSVSNSGLIEATSQSSEFDAKGNTIAWNGASAGVAGTNGIIIGATDTLTLDTGTLNLTGAGALSLQGGQIKTGTVVSATLSNQGNTISGFGTIGDVTDTKFTLNNMSGTIEALGGTLIVNTDGNIANNMGTLATSGTGAVLQIFDPIHNFGFIETTGGGELDIKTSSIVWDGSTTGVAGTNGIDLAGNSDELLVDVATLTLSNSSSSHLGAVSINGGSIKGAASGDTLVNGGGSGGGNVITGFGQIGDGSDGNLTLTNSSGTIEALNGLLTIETLNTVTNSSGAFLEAGSGGTLQIDDSITNNGTLEASGGTLILAAAATISGSGSTLITSGGTADFLETTSFTENVTFSGAGTLELAAPSAYHGTISGIAGSTQVLDLNGYDTSTHVADGIFTSGDTIITVTDSGHSTLTFTLVGNFATASWTVTPDASATGVDIADPPPAPVAAIASGTSLDISAPSSENVTFASGTGGLVLNDPEGFTGHIIGFTGTAPDAAHSDTVDLVGIDFNSAHFSDTFNSSSGLLTVTDGTNTAHITFDDFNATLDFASDGNGGTLITDPPASSPSGDTTSAPADAGMKFENDRIDLGGSQPANQSGDAAGAKPSLVLQHNGDDTFVFHHELGAETGPAPQADAHEAADHPDVQLAQQLASLITPDPHSQAVFELIHNDILAPTLPTPAQNHHAAQASHLLH